MSFRKISFSADVANPKRERALSVMWVWMSSSTSEAISPSLKKVDRGMAAQ